MNKRRLVGLACGLATILCIRDAWPQEPMRLQKTIPLPDVKGRIDHMAFDLYGKRLFVAALGNNTVEVADVQGGKVVHTITGLNEPQGVLFEPKRSRLWVANGQDGTVRIFDGHTFQVLRKIELGDDADNVREDVERGEIFVGYGSGGIADFDPDGNKIFDVKLDAHPESFQLERSGSRIFVNVPRSQKISVLDRTKRAVVANWGTGSFHSNFPMAVDEKDGRLLVVCRSPAVLLVLDTSTGTVVANVPTVGDADDVFFDQERKRVYVSGGEGLIAVYRQTDRDHYVKDAQIATAKGVRTSLLVPALSQFFLAVRQEGGKPAAIEVFDVK